MRPAPAERRTRMAEDGWTLMETMVVTTIVAILAGIAVPQFSALATQMRTNAVAHQLLTDIQYARVMAQRTGVPHYINVTGGTGVNYEVRREALPPAVNPATDPLVRTASLGATMAGVAFAMNGATTDCLGASASQATPSGQLVFNARGLPTSVTSYFIGSTDGANSYVVSVTGAGRVRLCRRVGGAWL
jgi:prepilin-type N-terminal cleavage/methylation domain-containing protein